MRRLHGHHDTRAGRTRYVVRMHALEMLDSMRHLHPGELLEETQGPANRRVADCVHDASDPTVRRSLDRAPRLGLGNERHPGVAPVFVRRQHPSRPAPQGAVEKQFDPAERQPVRAHPALHAVSNQHAQLSDGRI